MPLSALNFANRCHPVSSGDCVGFGLDSKGTADTLRELADAVESRKVILQSARVTSLASNEDYTYTGLRLVFAETVPKELYGPDSKFPEAIASPR